MQTQVFESQLYMERIMLKQSLNCTAFFRWLLIVDNEVLHKLYGLGNGIKGGEVIAVLFVWHPNHQLEEVISVFVDTDPIIEGIPVKLLAIGVIVTYPDGRTIFILEDL